MIFLWLFRFAVSDICARSIIDQFPIWSSETSDIICTDSMLYGTDLIRIITLDCREACAVYFNDKPCVVDPAAAVVKRLISNLGKARPRSCAFE